MRIAVLTSSPINMKLVEIHPYKNPIYKYLSGVPQTPKFGAMPFLLWEVGKV